MEAESNLSDPCNVLVGSAKAADPCILGLMLQPFESGKGASTKLVRVKEMHNDSHNDKCKADG